MVSAALGPDITVGVLLKTAVKRQLRMAALIPITTAWGMKSLHRAEKAVIPIANGHGQGNGRRRDCTKQISFNVGNLNSTPPSYCLSVHPQTG